MQHVILIIFSPSVAIIHLQTNAVATVSCLVQT